MHQRFALLLVPLTSCLLLAHAAFATSYQVNVFGLIDKGSSPTLFGLASNPIPFSFSFVLNDAAMTTVPAGTDITGGPDYSDSEYFLFPAASVIGLSLTVGDSSWTTTDLVVQALGTTGYNYAVLVSGALSNNNSAVSFKLQNASGSFMDLSPLLCGSGSCAAREDQSTAFATSEGAFGGIHIMQSSISAFPTAVTMDWTPIGKAGNQCDPQSQGCFGAVPYYYWIGTYEVTNAQYAAFLNAKAASDPLGLYDTSMGSGFGGITRIGSPGSYGYNAILGREDMPVNFVSFFDALRFANWMNNGQGSGDTESGAYTLVGGTATPSNGDTVTRNAGATIFLTSEDEWYKAAYSNALSTSYFDYPASSDTPTVCSTPTATPNRANCNVGAVTDLMEVGSYTGSASPYGTFDQGGNVWEWNEAILFGGLVRGKRGGAYNFFGSGNLAAGDQGVDDPSIGRDYLGFRVAMVPEHFQYDGNVFAPPITDITPPSGTYTTANRITALIALNGPLAPNLTNVRINDQVLGFRMNDGRGVLDEGNATRDFFVSTDSNGDITEWDLEANSSNVSPYDFGEQEHTIRTRNEPGFVGDFGIIGECVNPSDCQIGAGSGEFFYDAASNTNSAGTLPEPGAEVGLIGGVGALAMLAGWRRART